LEDLVLIVKPIGDENAKQGTDQQSYFFAVQACSGGTQWLEMSKWGIGAYRLPSLIYPGFVMKNSQGEIGLAREERLQIMLSPEELKAVDNFRFRHRMPSRAAAVRELLRHGIAAVGAVRENAGVKSGEYGVLTGPKGLGSPRSTSQA
jgi:hypothetical protein